MILVHMTVLTTSTGQLCDSKNYVAVTKLISAVRLNQWHKYELRYSPWSLMWHLRPSNSFCLPSNSATHCHFLCHVGSLASKIATIWHRHQLLQYQLLKKLFLQLPWHFEARATDLWLTNSIKSWGQMQWYSSNWKNVLSTKNISMWHWFHMNAGYYENPYTCLTEYAYWYSMHTYQNMLFLFL